MTFDVLFEKDAPLPEAGRDSLRRSRRYRPAHNVGHFRYLECSRTDERGQPVGDITPWDEIYFPFDPALLDQAQLERIPVTRNQTGDQLIEELYACDAQGIIEVSIVNHTTAHHRSYRLHGRPGGEPS